MEILNFKIGFATIHWAPLPHPQKTISHVHMEHYSCDIFLVNEFN